MVIIVALVVFMKIHWSDMYEQISNILSSKICDSCKNNGHCVYHFDSPVESICDDCEVELNSNGEFYCTKFAGE